MQFNVGSVAMQTQQ